MGCSLMSTLNLATLNISMTGCNYHMQPNGSNWDVVETAPDDTERVIATCREKDDAFIICRFYDQMEAGKLRTPNYSEAHRVMNHLLSLEPDPKDAEAIRAALPKGWEGNAAQAFNETARKHYGPL
jgi:hypothetical protein